MGFESFNSQPTPKAKQTTKSGIVSSSIETLSNQSGTLSGNEDLSSTESVIGATVEAQQAEVLFDDPKIVEEYTTRKEVISSHLLELERELNSVTNEPGEHADDAYINKLLEQREILQQEKVRVSANYPGNWTTLLQERILDPLTKEKFVLQRTHAMTVMQTGEPGRFDRQKEFRQHYQDQIDRYDDRVASIFLVTQVGQAREFSKQPHNLGEGNIDQPGTVFLDAVNKAGVPLTVRQKNIIEAHEKGHGLRDFQSPLDKGEVCSVIDKEALEELLQQCRAAEASGEKSYRFRINYLKRPEEIIERMAQFKNYFGMKASECFTEKHLGHIRAHYVSDTGLDNGVSELLACVTPKTIASFLRIINKYPV